jgi:hypothetical protein
VVFDGEVGVVLKNAADVGYSRSNRYFKMWLSALSHETTRQGERAPPVGRVDALERGNFANGTSTSVVISYDATVDRTTTYVVGQGCFPRDAIIKNAVSTTETAQATIRGKLPLECLSVCWAKNCVVVGECHNVAHARA